MNFSGGTLTAFGVYTTATRCLAHMEFTTEHTTSGKQTKILCKDGVMVRLVCH